MLANVGQVGLMIRRFWLVVFLAFAFGLLSGCGTLGNGKIDAPVSAYRAGRIFVFMDVTTKPLQREEVREAVQVVYDIALNNLVNADLTDQVVQDVIARHYPDATPEYRAVLFNLYKNMTISLLDQVHLNPELPELDVAAEFFRGVKDALALYAPELLPAEGSDELVVLLGEMEAVQ